MWRSIVLVILFCDIKKPRFSSTDLRKILKYVVEICLVGKELIHVDRETDGRSCTRDKVNGSF
jgi:hypothetical protein